MISSILKIKHSGVSFEAGLVLKPQSLSERHYTAFFEGTWAL